MRIAGTLPLSLVNGNGCRYVVFLQGCAHHCPGCHNPETWDFDGGCELDPKFIASQYWRHAHLLDGITLSGGDPFYQQEQCLALLELLPEGTDVWVYTGFEYETIKDTPLAKVAHTLVTGPYIESMRCEGKPYGSSNQEIHRKTVTASGHSPGP